MLKGVPDALIDDPRIVALSATLSSLRYRQFIAGIPGRVSAEAGSPRVSSKD